MPSLISKEEAASRIAQEAAGFSCALCALATGQIGPRYLLRETQNCVALLPRYARQWGHVMVLLRAHITSYQALDPSLWTEANEIALDIAKKIEEVLQPRRCYIASLGSSVEHPMTYPHLHLHIIPVYEASDTPSTILTTSRGVLVGTPQEFRELQARLDP